MLGLRTNVHRPIAEISIIVVGVLIALGVDSWNDNRIDRLLETQYLERLREDVSYNAEVFDGAPEEAFDRKVAYLEEVAELTVQPDDRFDLSSARNLLALSAVYGWAIPLYRTGTFEELKSTGNLGLIRDLPAGSDIHIRSRTGNACEGPDRGAAYGRGDDSIRNVSSSCQ